MKFFKVDDQNQVTHIVLENRDDAILYIDKLKEYGKNECVIFKNMLASPDASRLITHASFNSPIVRLASIEAAKFNYGMNISTNVVWNYMRDCLLDNFEDGMLVNKAGGQHPCPGKESFRELTEVNGTIEDFFARDNYRIDYCSTNHKFVVLENDPVLDQYTQDKFKHLHTYSYIVNLRDVLATNAYEDILEKAIKTLKLEDISLFIYTTGLDYEQMEDYVSRAVALGIKKFGWEFSEDSKPENIEKLKVFLSNFDIEYTIKDNIWNIA